jgi:hypothetical protein
MVAVLPSVSRKFSLVNGHPHTTLDVVSFISSSENRYLSGVETIGTILTYYIEQSPS